MSKSLAEDLDEAFERCRDMDASLSERLQALAQTVGQLRSAVCRDRGSADIAASGERRRSDCAAARRSNAAFSSTG